jgi:hypothetical protein
VDTGRPPFAGAAAAGAGARTCGGIGGALGVTDAVVAFGEILTGAEGGADEVAGGGDVAGTGTGGDTTGATNPAPPYDPCTLVEVAVVVEVKYCEILDAADPSVIRRFVKRASEASVIRKTSVFS